jgi:hypothetical protein
MTMALSYSRISDARQCMRKFKLKYIDKAPNFQMKDEDKSPALVRGGNIHKALEAYVVARLRNESHQPTLPEVLKTAPLIDGIMANYNVNPERQIAIDENFKEVSWFAKDAWFRVIYDLVGFGQDLLLGDYKTGKLTDYEGTKTQLGQLHMSGLVGMSLWPEYEECRCLYIYVDHKKVVPCQLSRVSDFEEMKEKLQEEHYNVNAERNFFPTKNRFCIYCDALKEQCVNSKK